MKKFIKLIKKLFGFGKDIADKIKEEVDQEKIRKVLAFTGQIIKGLKYGEHAINRNPQVDTGIEMALRKAIEKLEFITSQEQNVTLGDLAVNIAKSMTDHPREVQNQRVFEIALIASKTLFPKAKESHLSFLISGMILVIKKK